MDWTIVLWILGVLIAAVAVILIIASTKPNTFRVERRATINAPPEKIFPLLNDFHEWPKWSPWEKKDPNMRRMHSGMPSGKGAIYAWEGDKNVGTGSMEILESTPPSRLLIALNFLAPWQAKNQVEFTLAPSGAGATNVNWAMTGQNVFMGKVMGTVMNIDKMVGKDFEQGLANLKAAAER